MNQQINLLNPALLKQKLFVTLNNIALVAVVLLGLILAYSAYIYQQSRLLSKQNNQAAIELPAVQAQLKKITVLHHATATNQDLHNKIMQLERQEVMQQKILRLVSQNSLTDHKSYAAIMRAFAKQSLEGLWLTGFSIKSHTTELSISGRSLLADIVPEYIARLGGEAALQGKSFSALSMLFTSENVATNNDLASTVLVSATARTSAVAKPSQQRNYIEFVLKSHDEQPPANINPSKTGGQP
jgi:hypothetical protein